jgi:HEPN domain-containing protein
MASEYAELAREHLDRAEPHIPDGDLTQAITWLHLAAEAAIEALAVAKGIDTMKMHQRKARVAHELFVAGSFSVDLRDTLLLLNEARKGTNYGGSDVDLEGRSTEDLYEEIEAAVTDAERATG